MNKEDSTKEPKLNIKTTTPASQKDSEALQDSLLKRHQLLT